MKKYEIAIMSIALLLNSSVIMAGAITDNYAKGDVLSASTLGNIKTAVNDNNNALRFYGDGSAGPLTISATTDWNATPPAADNLNFTNVVIDAGATLTVPAGTTIRCTGSFTNNGTIVVSDVDNRTTFSIGVGKGDARRPAGEGQSASTLVGFLAGGAGSKGIPRAVAASTFNHFSVGGGAGAGLTLFAGNSSGGGLIKIYCKNAISNTNNIEANGANGSQAGGGGGGIIILASTVSIENSGAINAKGGNGSTNINSSGATGGGGGGIIVLAAPVITTSTSTLFVNGGVGGAAGGPVGSAHSAGGGGGASGGNGGKGGDISSSNAAKAGISGQDGYVLQIHANPAGMM